MQKSDLPRFTELLLALASTFGRDADRAFFCGYEMALDDLQIDSIEVAVRKSLKTSKFMPSGAELRELAGDVRDSDRAVMAFQAVNQAVTKYGVYKSVSFDDPVINATIRNLGGWERVSAIEDVEEWEVWFRKEFERVYVSLCRTGVSGDAARPLVGCFDRENGKIGYQQKFPVTIKSGLPPHRRAIIRESYGVSAAGISVNLKGIQGPDNL